MSKTVFLFVCLANLLPTLTSAEALISFPSGDLSFTVHVRPHDVPPVPEDKEEARRASFAKKADVSRTASLSRLALTMSNGDVIDYWRPSKLALTLFVGADDGKVRVRRGNDLLPPVFHLDSNKSWYQWIDAGSFKAEEVYRGVKCRRYEKMVVIPSLEGQSTPALYVAWIDVQTLRPLAFDDGESRFDIVFNGAPPPLTLPPIIAREFKVYQALLSPARRR